MTASEILAYVLVGIFSAAVMAASVILRKTMKLPYQACSSNKSLYNALLVIGLGAMLCIPKKTTVWVMAAVMLVLCVMVLKRLRDGVGENGVCMTGRIHPYSQFEAYSMRCLDEVTEFRFYRPGSIRMMAFANSESEAVERLLASQGLKKKDFQEIRVTV